MIYSYFPLIWLTMRCPSEKPKKRLSNRALISLVLMAVGCAAPNKTFEEEPGRLEPTVQKQAKEKESCTEQLREAMDLCLDMCKMRNIGAIDEDFDESVCEKNVTTAQQPTQKN